MWCWFQSTRPYGARRGGGRDIRLSSVSIHAPVWGATAPRPRARLHPTCFNPRARMGRDGNPLTYKRFVRVFQSTRPYGARRRPGCADRANQQFQSTRPYGARRDNAERWRDGRRVSIHAPVWGATPANKRKPLIYSCFNPRARMGRDPLPNVWLGVTCEFQSTRPYGARPAPQCLARRHLRVSIHAPVWGATRSPMSG